jgi:hypothetical protein
VVVGRDWLDTLALCCGIVAALGTAGAFIVAVAVYTRQRAAECDAQSAQARLVQGSARAEPIVSMSPLESPTFSGVTGRVSNYSPAPLFDVVMIWPSDRPGHFRSEAGDLITRVLAPGATASSGPSLVDYPGNEEDLTRAPFGIRFTDANGLRWEIPAGAGAQTPVRVIESQRRR